VLLEKNGGDQLELSCDKTKEYYLVKEERNPAYNTAKEANWIRHILHRSCFLNMLLKEREGKTGKNILVTTG